MFARAVRALALTLTLASTLAGTLVLGAPASAASGTAGRYHVPAAIDASGATDVTAALLRFFASVPNGSVIEFPAGARYRIDGSLRLVDRRDLVFEGNGAVTFAKSEGDLQRRHWWFDGGSNIVVRNLTVIGANPVAGVGDRAYRSDREFQHGFTIGGVKGFELDRVRVTDVYGDFVYVGKAVSGATKNRPATDVWIHDSHFERNGRQGVAITRAERVTVERNTITQTRRATIDLEPATPQWRVKTVRILDNKVGPGRLLFLASAGKGPVDDVVVRGNRLTGRSMNIVVRPPKGLRRSNFQIVDNSADRSFGSPRQAAIRFYSVDGVDVRGNRQPLQKRRDMALVATFDSCRVHVSGNTFPNGVAEARIAPATC